MTPQAQEYYKMTQAEVAQSLGISRSMVNYIEKSAIDKIKVLLAMRGIKVEDFL
jgi:DNA-directed RNA polymerase specialized sigma subunit